jgi:general secretion pathway protein A
MSIDSVDYLDYWGLARQPFSLAPCPETLFLSKQHAECLLRLKYAVVAGKGGALLISEHAGDGKTSVLRRLAMELQDEFESKVRVAFIDHPTLTPVQMLQEISRQIGIERPYKTKVRALNAFRERLLLLREAGERVVVIVDEGQMLEHRPDILQELRILLNFCVGDSFLLSLILAGQIALEGMIRSMPEFWQRMPVRFFLKNLDPADTRELVRHRLRVAGLEADHEIFTPQALQKIHHVTGGCPRVICSIADLALVVGRSAGVRMIDLPQVVQAYADMEKGCSDSFPYYHFLHSAESAAGAQPATPGLPPAPGLPVIVRSASQPTRRRTGSKRRWLKWLARSTRRNANATATTTATATATTAIATTAKVKATTKAAVKTKATTKAKTKAKPATKAKRKAKQPSGQQRA